MRDYARDGSLGKAETAVKPKSGIVVSKVKSRLGDTAISGSKVTGYRLYGLDGVDKVSSGEWFEADDDEAAIMAAKDRMDGHDCELWQGRRLVARLPKRR